MKLQKLLLLTAAITATTTVLTATTPEPTVSVSPKKPAQKTEKTLKHENHDIANRPKAPSRQQITCAYDGEYLTLNFVVPEGECEVTLTEWYTNAEQTYVVDSTPLVAEIYVGALYESTLTISTEKGNTYTADLTADPADE